MQVVLTLEEAERRALESTISLNAARVVRSGYIDRDELVSAIRTGRQVVLYGSDWAPYRLVDADQIEEPMLFVEVSRLGFDFPDDRCPIETDASSRGFVTTFFSAPTGELLGHSKSHATPWEPGKTWSDPLEHVAAIATPDEAGAPEGRAPRATETLPSELPNPAKVISAAIPVPLTEGEYPAGVRDTISAVPMTVGSTWRYRTVGVTDGVEWREGTVTETVDAAWRWTGDIMEVHLRHEGGMPWATWLGPRFVLPRSVLPGRLPVSISDGDDALDLDALAAAVSAHRSEEHQWGDAQTDPIEMVRLPLEAGHRANYHFNIETRETVVVPAGTFEDCYRVYEVISAGWSALHWLCPGVGFVRHQIHGAQGLGAGCTVFELEAYDLPWRVPVP